MPPRTRSQAKAPVVVVQSPEDKRLYRHITLPNGLVALLISDPEMVPHVDEVCTGICCRRVAFVSDRQDGRCGEELTVHVTRQKVSGSCLAAPAIDCTTGACFRVDKSASSCLVTLVL